MPLSNAQRQRAFKTRKRDRRLEELEQRKELFLDLWKAFPPGTFRVSVDPVLDADPDLTDPIRVSLSFPEEIKPQLADFALARGMDQELLIDRLTEEIVARMRKRGMVSDVDRHVVE